MTLTFFFQNLINALQWGSFYALIALGYSMVYSILMLFNFAHGDIFMVGAYIGLGVAMGLLALFGSGEAAILPGLGDPGHDHPGLHVSDLLRGRVRGACRLPPPARRAAGLGGHHRPDDRASSLRRATCSSWAPSGVKFPQLIKSQTYNLGGVYVTNKKIMIVLVSIGLMLALHQFVMRTKWGMAMRAMAYDFVVVPLMGVPLNTIAAMTFAIGSALAAAAGILFGIGLPGAGPYMGITFGWKAFVAAILGGRGSIMGACLGGFMLGSSRSFSCRHDLQQPVQPQHGSNLGPHRLLHHPGDPGVQAPRPLRRGPTARSSDCKAEIIQREG